MRYTQKNVGMVDFYILKEGKMHFAMVYLKELENLTIAFRIVFRFATFAGLRY